MKSTRALSVTLKNDVKEKIEKMRLEKVATSNAMSVLLSNTKQVKNCHACNEMNSFQNRNGETIFLKSMQRYRDFLTLSSNARATMLDKAGGCTLCTNYTREH